MDKDTVKTVLVDGGLPVALNGEENTRFIYNLLPVGRFYDKRYGEIYVGSRMLQQMEANFGKYPAYKVPVKIGHGDGAPSPGEVIGIQATEEGLEITMTVDKETSEEILKKRFRFMSAEFDENYMDKKTGEPVGAVLLGAALVNQPANPFMEPLKFVDDITPHPSGGASGAPDSSKQAATTSSPAAENEELSSGGVSDAPDSGTQAATTPSPAAENKEPQSGGLSATQDSGKEAGTRPTPAAENKEPLSGGLSEAQEKQAATKVVPANVPAEGKGTESNSPKPTAPAEPIDPKSDGRNEEMEKEVMEQLRKQLSDTEEREKKAREELEASLAAQKAKEAEAEAQAAQAQAQAEEAQKRIAELEAANEALNAEKERAEAARNEAEVKSFCDKWAGEGIPPAMLEKVKPFLLSRSGRSIKLSDDAQEETPTLKFFDELFAGLPKVPMGQIGSGETPPRELSDLEKAKKRGEAIAASV